MNADTYAGMYSKLLARLKELEEAAGYSLKAGPPASTQRYVEMMDFLGQASLPESYLAFLAVADGVIVTDVRSEEVLLHILNCDEVVSVNRNLVQIPEGVIWETPGGREVAIHTDHLFGFAMFDAEAVYCFIENDGGESPVYYHHQDEPILAKIVGSEEWVEGELPCDSEAASFVEWFSDRVREICERAGSSFERD